MTGSYYVTTVPRALLGLLAGAATGGATWTVYVLAWAAQLGGSLGIGAIPLIWGMYSAVYVGCLLLFGGPVWLLLHRWRKCSPTVAVLAGIGLSFAGASALCAMMTTPVPSLWLAIAPFAALSGAVVGWVIWRVAYRRAA